LAAAVHAIALFSYEFFRPLGSELVLLEVIKLLRCMAFRKTRIAWSHWSENPQAAGNRISMPTKMG
jgi:hypothetical protein